MIKINLGCASDYREGWINVDIDRKSKADVYADLNGRFPFKDNYADKIIANHIYEHIDNPYHFLSEIVRICKPNAEIHICSPFWNNEKTFAHPEHKRGMTFRTLTNETIMKGYTVEKINIKPTSVGKFIPSPIRNKLSYFLSGIIEEVEFILTKNGK